MQMDRLALTQKVDVLARIQSVDPRIAELVEEMLGALREEVKEMDRTNWLYETQDPQVSLRIVV